MMAIQRVLCGVDWSGCSRRAVEHAVALARGWGAHLTVLHVHQTLLPFDVTPQLDEAAVDASDPGLDRLRTMLCEFVKPVAGDLPVSLRLVRGADVRRVILAEVAAAAADLLVVGSHGRGGLEGLLLGSTSDAVVRTARCPVLVVPPEAEPPPDGRFRRLLCGIDFSPPSLRAFRYALHLASPVDGEVRLLHAIEMPPELRDRQITAAFDVESVRTAAEKAARQRLEALFPGADAPPVPIASQVVEGRAHRQILEVARQSRADIIVLGTHGRGAVDRWLFGSNTQAVLRDAPCAVLTVRPE